MDMYGYSFYTERDLTHYGIKGMHWGVRRWQNEDGTFNAAGKERYFGQGTGEDYHPIGQSSSEHKSKSSGSSDSVRSFDKEKAKKIAKGVAIGAAVVGGTILVAYGAKQLHDAGVLDKIREGRIINQKLAQDAKTDLTQIKAEGKEKRAQILSDAKVNLAKIRENTKLNKQRVQMDPMERLNADLLNKEIAGSQDKAGLKKFVQSLNDDEVGRINSGMASLQDIRKERSINGWSVNQEKYSGFYEKNKDYFGDVSKTLKSSTKKAYETVTSEQAKSVYKKTADAGRKAVEKAYKTVTSDQAREAYKKAGTAAVNATKSAASKTTNYVKSGQAKKDAQTVARSAKKAVSTAADVAKAAPQVISESKKVVASVRNERIIRDYKKQHPNTKLSDAEIVENYG